MRILYRYLQGPAGPKGDTGDAGAAGPNNVTTSTTTDLTGVLTGNGANVGVTLTSTGQNGTADSGKIATFSGQGGLRASCEQHGGEAFRSSVLSGFSGSALFMGQHDGTGGSGVRIVANGTGGTACFRGEPIGDASIGLLILGTAANTTLIDLRFGGTSGFKIDYDKSVTLDATVASNFLTALGAAKATPDIVTESGTTRPLSAADNGKVIRCTNGSGCTITVPASLGAGFNCAIFAEGGDVDVTAAASVDLNGVTTGTGTISQGYAPATLFALAADTFAIAGNVGTVA